MKEHGSLAKVLEKLDKSKHPLPDGVDYAAVKELFLHPEVTDPKDVELKWMDCNADGLRQFLVTEKVRWAAGLVWRGGSWWSETPVPRATSFSPDLAGL